MELKFKITKITKERRIGGNTTITAVCENDGIEVQVTISHAVANNRSIVRESLILKHNEATRTQQPMPLEVGEVL